MCVQHRRKRGQSPSQKNPKVALARPASDYFLAHRASTCRSRLVALSFDHRFVVGSFSEEMAVRYGEALVLVPFFPAASAHGHSKRGGEESWLHEGCHPFRSPALRRHQVRWRTSTVMVMEVERIPGRDLMYYQSGKEVHPYVS